MISEKSKAELVDQVIERVRARVDGDSSEGAERFVRQFYANVPPGDILGDAPENLAGAALALWEHAQERVPGRPKVRVYSPRIEAHGWESSHSVVEIVNDDMPFLVDSVSAELRRLDAEVQLLIHPIVHVERDADGRLRGLPGEGPAESLMHVRVSAQPAARHEAIRTRVEAVLEDVRAAVEDWNTIRKRCWDLVAELEKNPPPLPRREIAEGISFLEWLVDNHFTFLGYREYSFEGAGEAAMARVLPETGLGILRNEAFPIFEGLRNLGTLPEDVRHFLRQPALLLITKANRLSTVHRAVPMDAIAVKCFDPKGNVTGERIFVGLFTASAYSRSPRTIPILRQKVESSLDRAGFPSDSHDGKALTNILETYPRDELFQISEDELFRISMGILPLQQRPRIALFVRRDPFERFVSCLVFVPRDRYDTDLRLAFQAILARAYRGKVTGHHTHLTDEALARLHFHVATTPGRIPNVDPEDVERQLQDAARSWGERLGEALVEKYGEEEGLRLARRYGKAFPAAYQERFSGAGAVFDVELLERALATGNLAFDLYRSPDASPDAGPGEVGIKIYGSGGTIPLSDILPMLENMGLKVLEEMPYDVRPSESGEVSIRDFRLITEDGTPVDLAQVKAPFEEVFGRVWLGEMENDGFNRLVLQAGLVGREVTVLRAYCKYLRQARIQFSQAYMERTLARNPEITRRLVDLFLTLFDPARQEGSEERAASLASEIGTLLDQVKNVDEDRILRRFLNLVEATLRTNFFQKDAAGNLKSYLSLKLDSQLIEELPLPRPFREIFVFSTRVEAIHLRGGRVARGGIRWSDRPEDFRTEVLGLMKAQVVKNAVIVPVGSKGGFVVKRPPAGAAVSREELLKEGIECYKILMRGLLDVTDNLRGSEVVPPPDVVRRDDDDPYLVVAADKGTATFSDIANGVAAEYGFWLDDAFASGGSSGYDHKGMAITSRGVWESVKRHFRELGKDTQAQDFTVVGVGDMSGDVFGNGMLMSPHIRLLAAFDHRHVFVDPDPDAARSYEERKRLFQLPRSSWADYDRALISEGGGVFERGAKTIPVSAQMAQVFGIPGENVSPAGLIQALLKAEVELLWFGGIGTYVKARTESHADVGDRANDALRVDAADLRAKVIGEGANLGMTQRARAEYALRGGRLNTDFIDNSAGVDCSDHEVNIKILLGEVERSGKLSRPQRDELLREMTDEVAALVLRDNYLQTQALSVTQVISAHLLERLARFIKELERGGRLDRALEFLPDDETMAARARQGLGLVRPELCILLSYSKMALYEEILPSDLPDDPHLQEDLKLYFPTPLRKKYAKAIGGHRLSREIIATAVTNSIVNRAGITFVHEVKEKTGLSAADMARAYVVTREVFALRELWAAIEALDNKVPATLQAQMLLECGRLIQRATVWFLTECRQPLDIGGQVKTYCARVRELTGQLGELIPEAERVLLKNQTSTLAAKGVPEELAQRISSLSWMLPLLDIVRISRVASVPLPEVGKTYFAIGARFGFDWLRRAAAGLPTDKVWDKLAVTAIMDDLFSQQGELTARVLASVRKGGDASRAVDAWVEERRPLVTRTEQLLAELKSVGTPDLAMLAVANRQLKSMGGVGPSGT